MNSPLDLESELGGSEARAKLERIAGRIRSAREILITSHVHPDGDALGSELALAFALRKLGKAVRVVNDHRAPEKYAFLDPGGLIEILSGEPPADAFPQVDLAILLDTSEPSRAGRLAKRFFGTNWDRICLDHHPGPEDSRFLLHWVADRAPATGTLVLRLIDFLGVPLDRPIATALFVAIATDTGWFHFANTLPSTLRDAGRLVEAGVEPEEIHNRVYGESSLARLRLLGKLLCEIRSELDGRFAWALLSRAELQRAGVPTQELDGFSEQLKSVRGADVVALVLETAPGSYKVSLRSRGDADVRAIAADLGGGGHEKAAGCRLEGSWDDVLSRLRARVKASLPGGGPPAGGR